MRSKELYQSSIIQHLYGEPLTSLNERRKFDFNTCFTGDQGKRETGNQTQDFLGWI